MRSNQPDEERAAHGLDDRSEDEDEAEGDECARWVAMRSLAGNGDVGGCGESGAVVRLGYSEIGRSRVVECVLRGVTGSGGAEIEMDVESCRAENSFLHRPQTTEGEITGTQSGSEPRVGVLAQKCKCSLRSLLLPGWALAFSQRPVLFFSFVSSSPFSYPLSPHP